jgi:hypothetical protein
VVLLSSMGFTNTTRFYTGPGGTHHAEWLTVSRRAESPPAVHHPSPREPCESGRTRHDMARRLETGDVTEGDVTEGDVRRPPAEGTLSLGRTFNHREASAASMGETSAPKRVVHGRSRSPATLQHTASPQHKPRGRIAGTQVARWVYDSERAR